MHLATSGVGKITLNDFDCVEDSNLHRQIIHSEDQIGALKTHSAKRMLRRLNAECRVSTLDYQLEEDELVDRIDAVDVVLDCSDNSETRAAINMAALESGTPLIFGAAIRLEGQVACFNLNADSPCYACVYHDHESALDDCEHEGVLGTVPGIVGTMQALAAQLILTKNAADLDHKLLLFDALSMDWQTLKLSKNLQCKVCGH